MKLLIIPIACLVLGVGGGVGAGIFLKPEIELEADANAEEDSNEEAEEVAIETIENSGVEYADLSNQFIVPLLVDGRVESIIVLSVSLEVIEGSLQEIYKSEPKLRGSFLQVFFNHSNNGGFSGNFTSFSAMETLKRELLLVAQSISGSAVREVLIVDIIRQEA